jgi:type II secretory pathway component PulC
MDRVSPQTSTRLSQKLKGIAISARSKVTLLPLVDEMGKFINDD